MSDKEELSVGEVMGLFVTIWQKFVHQFLLIILFIIKHAIPLFLLLAIGIGLSFFIKSKGLNKIDFTISATEYSGEFLAESLELISEQLNENDKEIKDELSVNGVDFQGFSINVKPIYSKRSMLEKEELQHLEYTVENKLIPKENQEEMFAWSNTSYIVEMIFPKEVAPVELMNSILSYLRKNPFASQLHNEILDDINRQIQSNNQMLVALGDYMENLGKSKVSSESFGGLVMETGTNIGEMLFARIEIQRVNNKLIAEKVKLEENFRILYHTNSKTYSGTGIKSNKLLFYPLVLISLYLVIVFAFFTIRKALELDKNI